MKKYFIIIAALAAAISCSKEKSDIAPAPESESILTPLSFRLASEQTKTVLDGKSILWSTADKINVFSGASFGTNSQFSVTSTEEDGLVATFEGLGEVSPEYYAISPYQAGATIDASGKITASIPASQDAISGSFGPEANLSVAHITGSEQIRFSNAGALLSVTIPDAGISAVKIESLGGEFLTGTATVDYNDGEPTVDIISGNSYVESTVSGAGTYYFVVFPGNYSGGFKITLTRSGYTASVQNTKALDLKRNNNVSLMDIKSVPADAWKVVFTPGEKVFIKGLSNADENGQELSYITDIYYDPVPGGSSPSSPAPGDNSALAGITYNYEVWARIAEDDEVYFETESGARFALNIACDEAAPIGPDEVGPKISVSDSPYRIRLNLPTGQAQVVRVGIVNYSIIYGNVSENLNYDKAGAWKLDNYVFRYADNQSWDPTLSRYRFSVWFNWKGGQGGSNADVWQVYGNCTNINNTNQVPSTEDPANNYYYLQPMTEDGWDCIFYLDLNRLCNGGVNGSRKGTINLYMNNAYGHFTHGFSNVVDNN